MMRFSGLVRSRLSRRIWLTVLLLSIAVALVAQTPDTASLRGRVIDQSRASVAGARVVATNSLSRIVRSAQTDEFGYFSLAGLPITGTWSVAASKSGFADGRAGDLTLEGGTGANITLQLSVAGGQTLITVTGVAGAVRTDEPQLGDRLDSSKIEETPLLNRRITYLPLLNAANRPAINQGDLFMNQDLFTTNGAGAKPRSRWMASRGMTVGGGRRFSRISLWALFRRLRSSKTRSLPNTGAARAAR
jgi:hypothetical protein